MSHLRNLYPLEHRVFQGGRYLRAFDHAPDIDHYEHSILTFLGSLMPFDRQFVDHPAWPSIATIANSTKISLSTVRKKVRSLERKGYLKVEAVRYLNGRGHFEQSSNNYMTSALAFDFFEAVLESQNQITCIRKRAVGESYSPSDPPPTPHTGGVSVDEGPPLAASAPNSLSNPQRENLINPSSSDSRDIFTMKAEVDRIAAAWEDLMKLPVAKGEKDRFFKEYVRCRGNETFYMERLLVMASDPYISSRAKSINFLFSGLDCALKNKADIVEKASYALMRTESQRELTEVLDQLPSFIQKKSRNFVASSDAIINHLLQEPIDRAKKRLNLECAPGLPQNERELRDEIKRLLSTELSQQHLNDLEVILDGVSRLPFSYCLNLFKKFQFKLETGLLQ